MSIDAIGRAIRPDEVPAAKTQFIPSLVFDVFNEMIAHNFANGSAVVRQDKVVHLLELRGLKRSEIFDKGYLNIETAYQAAGWTVEYDKPGYNESYAATFTFKSK